MDNNNHEDNPNRTKLKQLADKMAELSSTADKEKTFRKEALEEQLRYFEEKVARQRPVEESRLHIIKQQTLKLSDSVKRDAMNAENKRTKESTQTKDFHEIVNTWIEEEGENNAENLEKLTQANNDKLVGACSQVQKQEQAATEKFEKSYQSVSDKVQKLKKDLKLQSAKREENASKITESIQGELSKFHSTLLAEKAKRKENQSKISLMIEEIRGKLINEVGNQKRRREDCSNSMLALLQTACQKLQKRLGAR